MRKIVLLLLLFTMLLCSAHAEPMTDAEAAADAAAAALYPFDRTVLDCTSAVQADGTVLVAYSWQHAGQPVIRVIVSGSGCEVGYDESYTVDRYYDELVRGRGGPFRLWPLEDKAWFSAVLPLYQAMEDAHMRMEHPDWGAQNNLLVRNITAHAHGLPDAQAIPQEDALRQAKEWLVREKGVDADRLDAMTVCPYYYADFASEPYWVFRFWEGVKQRHEVWLQAYTGEMPRMTQEEALDIALGLAAGMAGVLQEDLETWVVDTWHEAGWWRFRFTGNMGMQHEVLLDDVRLEAWVDGFFTSAPAPAPSAPAASAD